MNYQKILNQPKTIAIVGLSDDPTRPSFQIAKYLIDNNFTIIPVNPGISKVFGQKSYSDVSSIPPNINIDIVDVFRRSDQVVFIVEDVIKSGRKPLIWLQEGIENSDAQKLADKNHLKIISNLCIMKVHHHLP